MYFLWVISLCRDPYCYKFRFLWDQSGKPLQQKNTRFASAHFTCTASWIKNFRVKLVLFCASCLITLCMINYNYPTASSCLREDSNRNSCRILHQEIRYEIQISKTWGTNLTGSQSCKIFHPLRTDGDMSRWRTPQYWYIKPNHGSRARCWHTHQHLLI